MRLVNWEVSNCNTTLSYPVGFLFKQTSKFIFLREHLQNIISVCECIDIHLSTPLFLTARVYIRFGTANSHANYLNLSRQILLITVVTRKKKHHQANVIITYVQEVKANSHYTLIFIMAASLFITRMQESSREKCFMLSELFGREAKISKVAFILSCGNDGAWWREFSSRRQMEPLCF